MEGTISRGLKMTVRLLIIKDHDELVRKIQRCLTHNQHTDGSIKEAMSSVAQND